MNHLDLLVIINYSFSTLQFQLSQFIHPAMADPNLYESEPTQLTSVDLPNQCEISFDGFKQETDNPNQIETVHEGKKLNKISCEFCDATFRFESHLKSHVATDHEGKKLSMHDL